MGRKSKSTISKKLAKQFHKTKNAPVLAENVAPHSHLIFWWICPKGHEWRASATNRSKGSGCPICSGRVATKENSLGKVNPLLADQWNLEKNNSLSPFEVLPFSNKKVWWICEFGHEWEATINNRANGRGCPLCNKTGVSSGEVRIISELEKIGLIVEHRKKISQLECDIFLPDYKFAIEVDGNYWHKNKYQKDLEKNAKLDKLGVFLFRLRGIPLKKIGSLDISFEENRGVSFQNILSLLDVLTIKRNVSNKHLKRIEWYRSKNTFQNKTRYLDLLLKLPAPFKGTSFIDLYPSAAREWHPTKNGNLTPALCFANSHRIVWWKCTRGHEWEARVAHKSKGVGCPYCSGRSTAPEDSILKTNPKLAKEWHPTRNGAITPEKVSEGSEKIIWWKCDKGHEWESSAYARKIKKCPYCRFRKAGDDNNLLITHPDLVMEWNQHKNHKLLPTLVTAKFNKKVWWKCHKGHEWEASVAKRAIYGRGCPYCSNKKAGVDNNLLRTSPHLIKEWHPTKNKNLKPTNITAGSHKKAWWKCNKGHEWEAVIKSRQGSGCPYCAGKKATKENCLWIVDKKLAQEWHKTKNLALTPKNTLPNSNKKVWWNCRNGHEWQSTVNNRRNGSGCPLCKHRTPL